MRDPNRIDHVLGVLKRAWQQEPDLRLCQLISNAVGMATKQETTDCFYIEDETLLKGLEFYIEEIFRNAISKRANRTGDPVSAVQTTADTEGRPGGSEEVSGG